MADVAGERLWRSLVCVGRGEYELIGDVVLGEVVVARYDVEGRLDFDLGFDLTMRRLNNEAGIGRVGLHAFTLHFDYAVLEQIGLATNAAICRVAFQIKHQIY